MATPPRTYDFYAQADGSAVSILNFDTKKNANRLPAARNFVRRLKVLRHPYALACACRLLMHTK